MPKIKVEVDVPSGNCQRSCKFFDSYWSDFGGKARCILFSDYMEKIDKYNFDKCPACLKATRAKEKKR